MQISKRERDLLDQAETEETDSQCEACEQAIIKRLSSKPAWIKELDSLGFKGVIVTLALGDLIDRNEITKTGPMYHLNS